MVNWSLGGVGLRVAIFVLCLLHPWSVGAAQTQVKRPAAIVINSPPNTDDTDEDDSDEQDSEQSDAEDLASDGADSDEADEPDSSEIVGNVSIISDYVYRGLTQSNHLPALQGGFDWEHPIGLYVGVWGSSIYTPDSPSALVLAWSLGYTLPLRGQLTTSLELMLYSYFPDPEKNTWDVVGKLEWFTVKAEINYSPHWDGLDAAAWYLLAGWKDSLFWDVTLGFSVGASLFSEDIQNNEELDLQNYVDLRASAAHEFLGVNWELALVWASKEETSGVLSGSRAVVSVSKSF